MLTDDGQTGTKVWISANADCSSVSPFFAKPNVIGCLFRQSVKTKNYVKGIDY